MNDLQIFKNDQFGEIRTVQLDGEPWFVAADVCKALCISNHSDALTRLEDDEKDGVGLTDTIGRVQMTAIVNEPGLYSLVLGSRKPEAKAFKRWITHDVLPSIRKTGSYVDPGVSGLSPQLQAMISFELRQNKQESRLAALEASAAESRRQLADAVAMFAVPSSTPDGWAQDMTQKLNAFIEAKHLNPLGYRRKLYTMLEMKLGIDLDRRKKNYQQRLIAGGAYRRDVKGINMLQVIAQDAKLRAAFELILQQEMAGRIGGGDHE